MDQYLNPKELAANLSVKRGTIYSWISRKKIPFVKINGLSRFSEKEIEAWLEEKNKERKRKNFL
jgi:excisionase family DNA binding protein